MERGYFGLSIRNMSHYPPTTNECSDAGHAAPTPIPTYGGAPVGCSPPSKFKSDDHRQEITTEVSALVALFVLILVCPLINKYLSIVL